MQNENIDPFFKEIAEHSESEQDYDDDMVASEDDFNPASDEGDFEEPLAAPGPSKKKKK